MSLINLSNSRYNRLIPHVCLLQSAFLCNRFLWSVGQRSRLMQVPLATLIRQNSGKLSKAPQ